MEVQSGLWRFPYYGDPDYGGFLIMEVLIMEVSLLWRSRLCMEVSLLWRS